MVKLIAIYKKPQDTKVFDDHYFNVHVPLVQKLPGLKRIEVARISGSRIGESKYHLIAEMYFDSQQALDASMASPEGKASTKDLMSFASDLVTLFYAEVQT